MHLLARMGSGRTTAACHGLHRPMWTHQTSQFVLCCWSRLSLCLNLFQLALAVCWFHRDQAPWFLFEQLCYSSAFPPATPQLSSLQVPAVCYWQAAQSLSLRIAFSSTFQFSRDLEQSLLRNPRKEGLPNHQRRSLWVFHPFGRAFRQRQAVKIASSDDRLTSPSRLRIQPSAEVVQSFYWAFRLQYAFSGVMHLDCLAFSLG